MQPGSHGGGFFDNEEELFAAIERDIGPEAAEAARRSWRLSRNPRPLTDAERAGLRATLEPVLRDMRSTGAIVPDILEEAHDDLGPDYVCAWIQTPAGVGSQGIRVQVSLPAPERLADLADQLQEWEVEELAAAGRSATWPECPQHPDTHPLAPQVRGDQARGDQARGDQARGDQARGDQAVWSCPASGQVIGVIGTLPTEEEPVAGRSR